MEGAQIPSVAVETVEFLPPADRNAVGRLVDDVAKYDWVMFTSPRAVEALGPRLKGMKHAGLHTRFAAVGPSTAARLRGFGIGVDFVPSKYLTSALAGEVPAKAGEKALLLRADIADPALARVLRSRGLEVVDCAVYRTRVLPGRAEIPRPEDVGYVLFASPSEVRGFEKRVPGGEFDSIRKAAVAVCIGPVTAKAAIEAGFKRTLTPEVHTIDALVRLTREAVDIA